MDRHCAQSSKEARARARAGEEEDDGWRKSGHRGEADSGAKRWLICRLETRDSPRPGRVAVRGGEKFFASH